MPDLALVTRPAAPCHAVLGFDAALARMAEAANPLGRERIALSAAPGRVLAESLFARINSPPADLAAMDGYAVSDDSPHRLRVIGEAIPARPFAGEVGTGRAVRILTGARMPEGAGRVVAQELVERQGDHVAVPHLGASRRHVRPCGSDFVVGERLLTANRLMDPRAMLVAGAADVAHLTVWRRPRLSIVATGDELAPPGFAGRSPLSIPDSISLAVAALASAWGAKIRDITLAPDNIDQIQRSARSAIAASDILVVTGGASVGDRDFSRVALEELGIETAFSGVAIKPGKPVWYGRLGSTHVLGLPGNPTAALITARLFLAPLICRLTGRPASTALAWRSATLAAPLGKAGDRESFLCGDWDGADVRPLGVQAASSQANLASANVLIRRARSAPSQPAGSVASILDF